jgi:hypothetical protein
MLKLGASKSVTGTKSQGTRNKKALAIARAGEDKVIDA